MCVINPTEALYISITRTLVITMAITRQKKETVVKKLKDIVTNAKTIVFVHFSNVSGEEYENIRTVCEQENVGYMVAKKTLIKKAFEGNTVAGEMPALEGEIAVVYGEDITAPARVINEQGKKHEGKLQLVGGVFDNEFVSQQKIQEIADIPSTETLYAQFLTVIRAPVISFASVIKEIADKKA